MLAAGFGVPAEPDGDEAPAAKSYDETLIAFGSEVKALGDGHLTGYLVRFTTPDDPDLTGDYFDAETDFGFTGTLKTPVYFNHRLPLHTKDGRNILIRERIGEATLSLDTKGVLIDAIAYARTEYEKDIVKAGKADMLSWSSGTAAHLVDREPAGKAMHIKSWPLGLDASLTPTAAEPRNRAIPIKSYISGELPSAPDGASLAAPDGAPAANLPADNHKEFEMDEVEAKALRESVAANAKAVTDLAALVTAGTAQNAKLLEALDGPQLKKALGQVEAAPEEKRPFKSLGEQLFSEVKRAHTGQIDPRQDRLNQKYTAEMKALGMNESTLADGGAALQPDFSNTVQERAYTLGPVIPATQQQEIGPGSNAYSALMVNETSRADGSRAGAIAMYWQAEAGSYTSSQIKLRRFLLQLEKITGLIYATDENLADFTQLESLFSREYPKEFDFKVTDAIINGSGAGQPLGIVGGPSTISIPKENGQAAATVTLANLNKMWARLYAPCRPNAVWYINQDVEPQLDVLYVPAGVAGLEPRMVTYGPDGLMRIKNRPVVLLEQCQTLGTVGDIILADPTQYMLVKKGGLDMATSIHVAFTTGEQAFRFTARTNGAPIWNSALTPKNGSNSLSAYLTLATRS